MKRQVKNLKTLSLIGLGILLANIVNAQTKVDTNDKPQVAFVDLQIIKAHFGVKAGVAIANIKVTQDGITESAKSITRFTGGFFYERRIKNNLFLQPELNFEQGGLKLTSDGYNDKLVLNYLRLPILAKYTFPLTSFSLLGGPQIGYLLSAKETDTNEPTDNVYTMYKKMNLELAIGAEYDYGKYLLVSVSYATGLTNIKKSYQGYDNSGNPATISPDVRTTGYTFTLGFKIR